MCMFELILLYNINAMYMPLCVYLSHGEQMKYAHSLTVTGNDVIRSHYITIAVFNDCKLIMNMIVVL